MADIHDTDRERNVQVKEERDKPWEQPQSQAVEVKSTTMVKSARKLPVYQFSRLDQNTDLHRPPDNWLRTDAQLSKTWVTGECTPFSSFAMAETLPDTVGEVDVISAAENIKKLLKIPFSKAQVSMAVHCVGKTLLLDELDLFKHLRSASQRERDWMKTFLIEAVLSEGKSLTMKRKTNELLQNWNLLSKFLYYSIGNASEESVPQQSYDFEEQHLPPNQSALVQIPDLLPKTKPSEFARRALWQFEDIRMLIGTDLPIFGEGIHPAVSLRLKDMSSPINVLTGLDYWLDNLMSNVPELAMCYHLNGIVQKYELLKTEEIPNLEDAKFAPQVIKDIAQNILSFLKSHCTKEGHTYWLFKGQDEDVVKLYDLTSLCNEYPNRPWENPFISPVAMLLYRVARNLSMSGPSKKDKSTIYKLLKNCLQLLEGSEGHHPEVAASASHLLSHVFINEDDLTDPPTSSSTSQKSSKKPQQPDSSSGEDESEFVIEEEETETTLNVPTMNTQNLMLPSSKPGGGFKERRRRRRRSAKTVYASKEEKAKVALMYVVKGLKSIAECTESTETIDQEHTSKLPSPLPSPTRVRPLCYPKPPDAELKQLQEGPEDDQQWTEETMSGLVDQKLTFDVTNQLGKAQKALSVSMKTRNDSSAVSSSHVIHDESFSGTEQRSMSVSLKCDSQTSDHHVLVPRSSDVIPIVAFPEADGYSRAVLEMRTRDSVLPTESLVLTQLEDTSSSEQTAEVTPLTPLQEQSDGSDDSSGSFERLSWVPATDAEVSFLPTDSSVAERVWHPGSWQHKLNFLLLKKAWETYLVLAKAARDAERYGRALHFANVSLLCRNACQSMKLLDDSSGPNLLSDQLTVCGDCLTLLTHNLASYVRQREEFQFVTVEDRLILNAVWQHNPPNEYEWAVDFRNNIEHNLRIGILCYTLALSEGGGHADDYLIALTRKQGNAHNELGVYYMNQALTLRNEEAGLQKEQDLCRKSLSCFESGIEMFDRVNDAANISLLLCNIGKLMRMCALSFAETEMCKGSEMTQRERYYYNKAADYYQRALSRLGQRKKNPSLWESVTWELSSTYFAMATILQDHPPLSSLAQEQVEKDIIELMNKALNLCEVDDITLAKQPVYQYRAATIHHRLASMYHNAYRNQSSQQKQKHTRSLAELHYQRAVKLFQDLDRPSELLRVLLEKVALFEHQFEGQSGVSARIKTLHSALESLLQCKDALSAFNRARTKEATESRTSTCTSKDANKIATSAAECSLKSHKDGTERDSSHVDSELSNCKEEESKLALQKTSVPRSEAGNLESDRTSTNESQSDEHLQAKRRTGERLAAGNRKTTEQKPAEVRRTQKLTASGSDETLRTVEGVGSKEEGQGSKIREGLTKDEADERHRLESMWESRLQYVLLNLVKLHGANKKGVQHVAVYKLMYAASLGRTLPSSSASSLATHPPTTATLMSILDHVRQLFQNIK